VNLQEARADEQLKEVLDDQQKQIVATRAPTHFRRKSYSVAQDPRYQEIREKFGRTINSKAYLKYQQEREEQRAQA